MNVAENQKQPISVTHPQHEFNVTNEMDQELQQCCRIEEMDDL